MKKLVSAVLIAAVLFSCKSAKDSGQFTVEGNMKSTADQKVYLEELYFSDKQPEVLDTGIIKDGKFTVSAIAPEEGLYRLRFEQAEQSYIFISEGGKINFTGDLASSDLSGYSFSGAANSSLKNLMRYTDSVGILISNKDQVLGQFVQSGVKETDSTFMAVSAEYKRLTDDFTSYAFAFADTAKNPVLALFAATMAPVQIGEFEKPISKLVARFPKHQGLATALTFIKSKSAPATQPAAGAKPTVGSMAPDLTMNDVNDKPFSLSQLRGKYVLVDFWASWCAPCRAENPNVVAAYEKFKDKNFTVLGVSLDKDKAPWLAAIKDDKLNWHQISDLKFWNTAAIPLYGFDGIPYNVLVDPQGKIIATGLREAELHNKLAEVLK